MKKLKLNELLMKYDEMSLDLCDLMEWMRGWNCPDLKIEERQIPEELKTIEAFEKKNIAPLTGGELSRLHENVVEYYIYDSENESEFLPLIPQKFVTYEKEYFAPGMVKITLIYGQKIRKENDFRFTDKINVHKDPSYFLYDYNTNQYKQVNPKKNEWIEELAEREEIRKKSVEFIYYYKDLKNSIWLKKQNPFDKGQYIYQFSPEINSLNNKEFIETINFFLNLSEDYLYVLQFFGSITKNEYNYLLKAIDKQKEYNNKTYEYIILEEEKLLDEFTDVLNLPKQNPFLDTKIKMARLLTPREERLDVITPANYYKGYIYIDTANNKLYPNLGELERKVNVFQMAANAESEKEIINKILDTARQVEKYKILD